MRSWTRGHRGRAGGQQRYSISWSRCDVRPDGQKTGHANRGEREGHAVTGAQRLGPIQPNEACNCALDDSSSVPTSETAAASRNDDPLSLTGPAVGVAGPAGAEPGLRTRPAMKTTRASGACGQPRLGRQGARPRDPAARPTVHRRHRPGVTNARVEHGVKIHLAGYAPEQVVKVDGIDVLAWPACGGHRSRARLALRGGGLRLGYADGRQPGPAHGGVRDHDLLARCHPHRRGRLRRSGVVVRRRDARPESGRRTWHRHADLQFPADWRNG